MAAVSPSRKRIFQKPRKPGPRQFSIKAAKNQNLEPPRSF
jgi:hypothetical protein